MRLRITRFRRSTFVAQAENAVKGLKDPELKRIAFQKVLDDLIGASDRPSPTTPAVPSGKAKKTTKASSATSAIAQRTAGISRRSKVILITSRMEHAWSSKNSSTTQVCSEHNAAFQRLS